MILNINTSRTDEAFADLGIKNFRSLFTLGRQTSTFDDYEIGSISSDQFRRAVMTLVAKEIPHDAFDRAWNALLLDAPTGRIELLRRLRTRYKTFLFSNTNEIHYRAFTRHFETAHGIPDLAQLFDGAHYSFTEGLRKPDVAAYQQVIKKNGLNPERTIFIDDSATNVDGAIRAGLRGYHLNKIDLLDAF